jgi:hypothetical protein
VTRRRLAAATIIALAAAGTLGASAANADGDYIACVGLRVVPVATCVEEPVGPILDQLPVSQSR